MKSRFHGQHLINIRLELKVLSLKLAKKSPNQCIDSSHDCDEHAQCRNFPGTWSCKCHQGFNGTGYPASPCIDRDECTEGIVLTKLTTVGTPNKATKNFRVIGSNKAKF